MTDQSKTVSDVPAFDRGLEHLDWRLAPAIAKLLQEANSLGMRVAIFEGRRTAERAQWLHQHKEMLNVDPPMGKSRHENGEAADIVFQDQNGSWSWSSTNDWATLGRIGEALGLIWGGRDNPYNPSHFELAICDPPRFQIEELEHPEDEILGCGGACSKCG